MDRSGIRSAAGAPRPRLLLSTGPLLMSPLDWVFETIAEAGFAGVELMLAHNPDSRDPEKVLAYAARAGLDVPVVHGPYLLVLRNVLGSGYAEKTRRALEITAEIGADILVAHAPFRWESRARAWAAGEAEATAEELGVQFAMENLFPVAGRAFSSVITPEQLTPFSSVVLDTSHLAVAGVDLFEAWDAVADRTTHVHLSDNFGNGRDSHAPLGAGVLPLQAFVNHIGASGWSGSITLELDCRAHLDSRDNLVAFFRAQREKAEAWLAGEVVPEEVVPV